MGRHRRSHLPGGVFHLTSRTQGRERWFTPTLRDRIGQYLAHAVSGSDISLLAYAIMPNHLHLVIRQGRRPLWWFMQPLLRRIALLVQRTHGLEGHVFERRFGDQLCGDADYTRNSIVYAHLNPVRAGLVEVAEHYPWTSHAAYCGRVRRSLAVDAAVAVEEGLRLFAPTGASGREEQRGCYRRFFERRFELDRRRGEEGGQPALPAPCIRGGDEAWALRFSSLAPAFAAAPGQPDGPVDLEGIAKQTLAEMGDGISLAVVRSGFKGRAVVAVRRSMIRRMAAAGHKGTAIARYLGVSNQCVSAVLRSGS